MSSAATVRRDVAKNETSKRTTPAHPARYFFAIAAGSMLMVMLAGFHPYYLRGEGMAGRKISPELATLVLVHGAAMTAWLVLFLAQSVLVPARRLRVHMKLGWGAAGVAMVVSFSGFMLAVESVRPVPNAPFWGMAYRQFLMVMLAEVALFTLFVLAGVLSRKRPRIHRAMMMLASLSILAGATVRMPVLFPVFGEAGWVGIFGPIFALGALFVVVRSALAQTIDRWLVAGYTFMAVVYVASCEFAVSDTWSVWARAVFKV
ncbi:MAG TPA: hypothetical protein VLK65_18570 [Vicinamibacteria bacterium]|nr:hypothetical protein [Vicinamibacteria bacterium]